MRGRMRCGARQQEEGRQYQPVPASVPLLPVAGIQHIYILLQNY